jgi:hypothetical protein
MIKSALSMFAEGVAASFFITGNASELQNSNHFPPSFDGESFDRSPKCRRGIFQFSDTERQQIPFPVFNHDYVYSFYSLQEDFLLKPSSLSILLSNPLQMYDEKERTQNL